VSARRGRWLAALVAAAALVVLPATAAAAHDSLQSTTPADGASVTTAPTSVVLTFDQPALALGTALVVTAPDGTNVDDGAARLVDSTVQQPIAGTLPAGTYTVVWRVTSADGHPVSGSFHFTAAQATSRARQHPLDQATAAPATASGSGSGSPAVGIGIAVAALVVAGLGWLALRRRRATIATKPRT